MTKSWTDSDNMPEWTDSLNLKHLSAEDLKLLFLFDGDNSLSINLIGFLSASDFIRLTDTWKKYMVRGEPFTPQARGFLKKLPAKISEAIQKGRNY